MMHAVRALGVGVIAAIGLVPPRAPSEQAPSPLAAACVPASQCCAVCTRGRACGNSCISAKKQCHKGRGCACNAAEVCSDE